MHSKFIKPAGSDQYIWRALHAVNTRRGLPLWNLSTQYGIKYGRVKKQDNHLKLNLNTPA